MRGGPTSIQGSRVSGPSVNTERKATALHLKGAYLDASRRPILFSLSSFFSSFKSSTTARVCPRRTCPFLFSLVRGTTNSEHPERGSPRDPIVRTRGRDLASSKKFVPAGTSGLEVLPKRTRRSSLDESLLSIAIRFGNIRAKSKSRARTFWLFFLPLL